MHSIFGAICLKLGIYISRYLSDMVCRLQTFFEHVFMGECFPTCILLEHLNRLRLQYTFLDITIPGKIPLVSNFIEIRNTYSEL